MSGLNLFNDKKFRSFGFCHSWAGRIYRNDWFLAIVITSTVVGGAVLLSGPGDGEFVLSNGKITSCQFRHCVSLRYDPDTHENKVCRFDWWPGCRGLPGYEKVAEFRFPRRFSILNGDERSPDGFRMRVHMTAKENMPAREGREYGLVAGDEIVISGRAIVEPQKMLRYHMESAKKLGSEFVQRDDFNPAYEIYDDAKCTGYVYSNSSGNEDLACYAGHALLIVKNDPSVFMYCNKALLYPSVPSFKACDVSSNVILANGHVISVTYPIRAEYLFDGNWKMINKRVREFVAGATLK